MLKIAPELKKYVWQKLKLEKNQNVNRTTINKQVGSLVIEVRTSTIVIDNHMVVIQVQIGKNTVEDVLLDGCSKVNIITK